MMPRRIPTVAFLVICISAIPSLVSAQNSCTLCQDGSSILAPDVFVEHTQQTCAQLEEEASYYSDPVSCRYYHRFGNMCGCSNTPPKESFCHLCQDKSPLPDPDKTLYGYPGTCADLQEDAAWNFWQTLHPEEELSSCNFYHHTGTLCGCPNNEPPKDGCDLCFDGNPPLLPDKSVTPYNAAESTCESYALYNKYLHTEDSDDCTQSQSIVGSYCGCSQIPRHTDRCNICPDGYVPKADAWAPDMEVISGNRIFTFNDATCIKVAMLMADYEFPCSTIPEGFVEVCCESAVGMLSSEVFLSSNWINRTKEPLDYSTFTFFPSSSTKLFTRATLTNLGLLIGTYTLVSVLL